MRVAIRRALSACVLAILGCVAWASGLQVSPVSVRLVATQNAEGLTLSNTGTEPLQAQVRVYQWTQADGKDQLAPSRGLVISPPQLSIEPGGQQLVRVIRTGAPPAGTSEDAFRLAVDELPSASPNPSPNTSSNANLGKNGLQFVLHYSVPVFVEPPATTPLAHQLSWQLVESGGKVALQVSNTGTQHAQLARLIYTGASGAPITLHDGLLGYVLPGATMRWPLNQAAAAFAGSGTLEALVNGAPVKQQSLPLVRASN